MIDQRGTGEANGLNCPPPPSATDLKGRVFDPARLTSCRDELAARFPHVTFRLAEPLGRHPLLLDVVEQRAIEAEGR